MWSGRIEADERENRDGEDEEHEPERHDTALGAEARHDDQVQASGEDREVLDLQREEHHPEPEHPRWRHGVYGFHPLRWGRIGVWGCEHGPQSQNEEQYPDRHADDAADRRDCASAPLKSVIPEIPITAHVVKYPSMRAPALGRGLWEPRNRIVSRSNGGAIEPPMARTTSPGRRSLIRTRRFRAGARRRRAGYHGIWIPLPTQAPVTRAVERSTWWPLHSAVALPFVREGLAQFVLLLLGQVCRDDLEVVRLQLVDDLVGRRRPAGQSKQR